MTRSVCITILLLSALLSACTPGSPPAPAIDTLPAAPEAAALMPPTTDDGVVTISFGSQDYMRAAYAPLIDRFNAEHPTVQVQFVALDLLLRAADGPDITTSLADKSRAVAQTTDTSDYYPIDPEHARRFQYDLRPFIDADPFFQRTDFLSDTLEALTQDDGALYLLPAALKVQVLSYNRDLFRARGVPEPAPDWTWADLRAAAQRLADQSNPNAPIYGLLTDSNGYLALAGELAAANPALRTTPPTPEQLDQPPVRAALQSAVDLAASGAVYVETSGASDLSDYAARIRAGQVGIWATGLISPTAAPFDVGTVAYPDVPTGVSFPQQSYVMSVGTQHPEAAWQWLAFLSQQSVPMPPDTETGILVPARQSLIAQRRFWDTLPPDVVMAVQATIARPPPVASAASAWAVDLIRPLKAVLRQERSLDAALQQAQTDVDTAAAAPAPTAAPETIIVGAPAAPDPRPGSGTITFSAPNMDSAVLQQLVLDFRVDHRAISVRVTTDAPQSLRDVAATADCFSWWGPPAPDDIPALLNLQPLLDADATFPRDDVPAPFLAPFRAQGQLYGMPYQLDPALLYYDMAALPFSGPDAPTVNWTWDDLYTTAVQRTQRSGSRPRYGFASLTMPDDLLHYLDATGVALTRGAGQNQTLAYTDPAVVQALDRYLALLRDASPQTRFVYGQPGVTNVDARQRVASGQVALWLDSQFTFRQSEVITGVAVTTAMLPLPTAAGQARIQAPARGLYIAAATPRADACWTWLTFVSSRAFDIFGGMPVRDSIVRAEDFPLHAMAGMNEVYAAYSAPTVVSTTVHNAAAVGNTYWLFQALDQALQGQDLARALAAAQTTTAAYLTCVQGGSDGSACARQVDPSYQEPGAGP